MSQLNLFDLIPEEPIVKKIERKGRFVLDLSIHETINLRYSNIPCHIVYMRQKIRQKRGYEFFPIDRENLKRLDNLNHLAFKPCSFSVATTLWLKFKWIDKRSSLRPDYFNRELTFEDIQRGYFKDDKPKTVKKKKK